MGKLSELKKNCYKCAEVMDMFEIDRPKLCRMGKQGIFNPVMIGGRNYYSKKEVDLVYADMVNKLTQFK